MYIQGIAMKHNIKIPGWNGQEILDVIGKYAAEVPENGNILELGALFGRSTYTLGYNKKDSVKLITIDLWPEIDMANHTTQWIHDSKGGDSEHELVKSSFVVENGVQKLPGTTFYKLWNFFTSGIVNNTSVRGFTITPTDDYPMFNFIFHDASHDYEGVYNDLVHWYPKLLPDGVIIIDDYEPAQFPGVIKAVDQFADEHNLIKEMVTGRNVLLRNRT